MSTTRVTVVGGGLAGCEAAIQLARRGIPVTLVEMKPSKRTPAQSSDGLCELVCSNSLRGAALSNAVGLLKEELRLAGSAVMQCALEARVPAGGALAVDRERFSQGMMDLVRATPGLELECAEATAIPAARPVVLATGPLTSDLLAADLARTIGGEHLAYYDAIAPIVEADSIDWSKVWRQSRYDKGGADYVNCGFDREGYEAFVRAIVEAEKVVPHAFEELRYFEGCLPVEVMAERGVDTLRYGPLKPVGLVDPNTGRRPYAVVQLRAEDLAGTAFNLVGFQSRMTWPEQRRVFRMIPGLERAEFVRLGAIHRNTFVDAPNLLDETMQLRAHEGVYLAGQITGVEGYIESAAGGFLCGLMLARRLRGEPLLPPPPTTALGALLSHLSRPPLHGTYQPSNVTWAHVPALEGNLRLKKRERYRKLAERGQDAFAPWLEAMGSPTPSGPPFAPPLEDEPEP
ncbi:MAG: methylenetetrahydrofolate--tRNA-(uracil(54)-C(5))-methyltransferase (FADH(2)-oxidizing) TrmFO [Deltaproteobacteria bacterium]|nr:methylenetetrahydrofolate--tRNA-(uracil(54)-C(5))-methyltransferase (FADH(2)-oxidizing) TrmFO [Deltaproteobacteria bacterium]